MQNDTDRKQNVSEGSQTIRPHSHFMQPLAILCGRFLRNSTCHAIFLSAHFVAIAA